MSQSTEQKDWNGTSKLIQEHVLGNSFTVSWSIIDHHVVFLISILANRVQCLLVKRFNSGYFVGRLEVFPLLGRILAFCLANMNLFQSWGVVSFFFILLCHCFLWFEFCVEADLTMFAGVNQLAILLNFSVLMGFFVFGLHLEIVSWNTLKIQLWIWFSGLRIISMSKEDIVSKSHPSQQVWRILKFPYDLWFLQTSNRQASIWSQGLLLSDSRNILKEDQKTYDWSATSSFATKNNNQRNVDNKPAHDTSLARLTTTHFLLTTDLVKYFLPFLDLLTNLLLFFTLSLTPPKHFWVIFSGTLSSSSLVNV